MRSWPERIELFVENEEQMKSKMKLKWIFIAAVVLTAVLLVLHSRDNEFLPDDLLGHWTTSAPKYTDRFLELSEVAVIFGTGKDNIDVNFISSVDKQVEGGSTMYTIQYHNLNGMDGQLSFYWDPSEKVIRLKNQKRIIWKKAKELF